MENIGIIDKEKTAFVLVDIQEKFIPVIYGIEELIKNSNLLIKSAQILKMPILVTEQYPKGLGKTSEKIKLSKDFKIFEKVAFSAFGCKNFVKKINELELDTLIIFGIETHVCILQTALDLLNNNFEVHVVEDATSSRTLLNKRICIERMRQSGAFIVSTEMILFQLMKKADIIHFKEISELIK